MAEQIPAITMQEIKSVAQLDDFINRLADHQELALHIETNYHHPMWAQGLKIYLAAGHELAWLDLQDLRRCILGRIDPVPLRGEPVTG